MSRRAAGRHGDLHCTHLHAATRRGCAAVGGGVEQQPVESGPVFGLVCRAAHHRSRRLRAVAFVVAVSQQRCGKNAVFFSMPFLVFFFFGLRFLGRASASNGFGYFFSGWRFSEQTV